MIHRAERIDEELIHEELSQKRMRRYGGSWNSPGSHVRWSITCTCGLKVSSRFSMEDAEAELDRHIMDMIS